MLDKVYRRGGWGYSIYYKGLEDGILDIAVGVLDIVM